MSEKQAQAIVDMRLGQLTGLDQDKLRNEYAEVEKMIAYYKEILADESVCMKVVKDELLEIKEKYGDERKTEIIYSSEEFNASRTAVPTSIRLLRSVLALSPLCP